MGVVIRVVFYFFGGGGRVEDVWLCWMFPPQAVLEAETRTEKGSYCKFYLDLVVSVCPASSSSYE